MFHEATWQSSASHYLNLQEFLVSATAASGWMLHCWEPWRWNLLLSVITAVPRNSCSAAKSHEIIFNSFTSSGTAVQVGTSEAKVSRVPPLFPVMREKKPLLSSHLSFFFLLLVNEGHCVEKQVTCTGLSEIVTHPHCTTGCERNFIPKNLDLYEVKLKCS